MRRIFNILVLLTVAVAALAQISVGGAPMPFNPDDYARGGVLKGGLKFSMLGAYDFFQTLDVDTVYHPADDGEKRFVAGNVCKVDITPYNSGITFNSNGYKVWRAGITSPGAVALSVVFSEFNIPDGANLFLYNPSQSIVIGSFSSNNNNFNNILPVQPLSADTVIVEYQEPAEASGSGFKGRLRIGYASHNFFDTNGYLKRTNPDGGITCSPQAFLDDPQNPAVNASCLIYVTGTDMQKSWYGSGSLLNNPDGKPYVISSNHVFYEGKYAPTSVFFFQNHKVREGVKGSSELSMAGASSVTAAQDLDMAMVELYQMPPKDYRPYLAGWDANESAGYLSPYKCIHHPNGDFTKISYANVTATISKVDFETQKFKYKSFWKISRWNVGATQGGSSGSPLFNSDGKIIGCLTGGSSFCENPVNDYFWQLSYAWEFHVDSEMQLKRWLDPHNQGVKSMDGADPYAYVQPCYRVSNFDPDDIVGYQRLCGSATGYQAGHNSLGCTAYAERYLFDEETEVYGVYVGSYKGKYVSGRPVYVKVYDGGLNPGAELASVDVRPYDYAYKYDGTISETITKNWNTRDTYVRFPNPVQVKKGCFIGVSFQDYATPDTLAIYQTTNRASGNSAYYYRNGVWSAFTSYPSQPQAASLWLQPVVADVKPSGVDEIGETVKCFDIVVADGLKAFSIGDTEKCDYVIKDMGGKSIASGSLIFSDKTAVVPFDAPQGLYIIALQGSASTETHKFLWR